MSLTRSKTIYSGGFGGMLSNIYVSPFPLCSRCVSASLAPRAVKIKPVHVLFRLLLINFHGPNANKRVARVGPCLSQLPNPAGRRHLL